MTLADNLKVSLDAIRSIPGRLSLRPYQVVLRTRQWSGSRAGLGSKVDTDGYITVADGYSPSVKQLSERDIAASGGLYSDQDLEMIFTAAYVNNIAIGGFDPSFFDPVPSSQPMEIFFKLYGPGLPATGAWYKKKAQRIDSVLTYSIILTKTGSIND